MLSPELAIGIRRVKGVKRLGTRIGNWLSTEQAQDLLNSIPRRTIRGRRDAALVGLLLGCGLRRSEAVSLRLDQIQLREGHLGRRRPVRQGRTAANGARSGLVQGSNRPLASCLRSFRRARIQANLEKQDRTKSWDRSRCCLDSSKAICKADRSGSPGAARPSSYLRSALPPCRRRTRKDSIPARSRLSPNDGTVHWVQTEVQRCGQRSVPNITGNSGVIIRFVVHHMVGEPHQFFRHVYLAGCADQLSPRPCSPEGFTNRNSKRLSGKESFAFKGTVSTCCKPISPDSQRHDDTLWGSRFQRQSPRCG